MNSIATRVDSFLMISRNHPTTKLCPNCDMLNKTPLSVRIYNCECGYNCDRDIHSARNMIVIGSQNYSLMERKSKGLESKTNTSNKKLLKASYDSMKAETHESLVRG